MSALALLHYAVALVWWAHLLVFAQPAGAEPIFASGVACARHEAYITWAGGTAAEAVALLDRAEEC